MLLFWNNRDHLEFRTCKFQNDQSSIFLNIGVGKKNNDKKKS